MTEVVDIPPDPDTFEGGAITTPLRSRRAEVWSALVANRLAVFGLVVLGLLVLAAIFGPASRPYGANEQEILNRFAAPSRDHWFGTDDLGRDVFSRVLIASRASLQVGIIAVGIALVLGLPIGLVAGFYGRATDGVLMRLMDMLFAFPAILLAIAIVAVRGPGLTNAMIAIGIVYMPIFARIARGSVITVRNEVYVRAARSLGATDAADHAPAHPAQHRRPADRADVAVDGVRHPVGGRAVVPRARRAAAAAVVGADARRRARASSSRRRGSGSSRGWRSCSR